MLIASISKLDWRRPFASKYFRYAGGYLAAKVAIFSLLGLVGQYLLTHKLTVNDYGLLVWVGTIIALLSPFGLPGISNSIAGAVAKGYDGNFRRGTWMEIIGGTLGGLVLLAFAAYYWIWLKDLTKAMIFLVAGVFGPGLWLDTQQCYWNGKRNFRALFWWSVPVRFLQLVATAAVLWYSTSPILVFFANTFIQVIANIGAAVGIIKYGNINNRNSEEFLSYGWVTNHLSILGTITSQIDKVLIGVFFSLEQLAIFAVGEMISSPRIQEYIMWIAPKEKAGLYMGTNFVAVFIGATLSGLYTGIMGSFEAAGNAEYIMYLLAGHTMLGILAIYIFTKTLGEFKELEA